MNHLFWGLAEIIGYVGAIVVMTWKGRKGPFASALILAGIIFFASAGSRLVRGVGSGSRDRFRGVMYSMSTQSVVLQPYLKASIPVDGS